MMNFPCLSIDIHWITIVII